MKKFVCGVCGYVFEGNDAPEKCPQCGAPKEKFTLVPEGPKTYADEHQVGVAKGLDEKVVEGLRLNFTGECSEVGMYLAMSRVADRQGYPEVAEAYKRIAFGEVVTADTKENLEMRALAEQGACAGKKEIATLAKQLGYDAIHDTVHEMAKDEARHGRVFDGLLARYFAK